MDEFVISFITKDDEKDAVLHLRENFCKDEPILNYLKLDDFTEFDDLFVDDMKDGISLKAVDRNGKIAAILLIKLVTKNVNIGGMCMCILDII